MGLLQAELSDRILDAFFQVHFELGSGFPESVYANAMEIALADVGVAVQREHPVRVYFRKRLVGRFKADSVADSCIILEYKSSFKALEAGEAQLLNYLRCSEFEVGLVLCFSPKPTVKRCIMTNDRKGERHQQWVTRNTRNTRKP